MFASYSELLAPVIVGGIIGIAGGVAATIVDRRLAACSERRNLTSAMVGEISAILSIVERRHFIEDLRVLIPRAMANPDPTASPWFTFSVAEDPFPVFKANVSRIGLLRSPLPKLVATFYVQAQSVIQDARDMAEWKTNGPGRDEAISRLEEFLTLLEDTMRLGRDILTEAAG